MTEVPSRQRVAPQRVVGRVLRAHGVHGALVVVPLTNQPDRFAPGARLLAGPESDPVTVEEASPYKGRLLVRFAEVGDRDAAESLRRCELRIAEDDAGAPPPGEVWAVDLEGLPVVAGSADGEVLGTVFAVVDNPAHDLLLVADAAGREFMIPLVEEFVDELDPDSGVVVVHPIPGLLPEDAGPDPRVGPPR